MKKRYDGYYGDNRRTYVDLLHKRKLKKLERDLAAGKFLTNGAGGVR